MIGRGLSLGFPLLNFGKERRCAKILRSRGLFG